VLASSLKTWLVTPIGATSRKVNSIAGEYADMLRAAVVEYPARFAEFLSARCLTRERK
jgi:hypothetical protein